MRSWNTLWWSGLAMWATLAVYPIAGRADEPGATEEPPAELFVMPNVEIKACQACECPSPALTTWFDTADMECGDGSENWASACFAESGVALANYLDSGCPYIASGGAASGSYPSWQPETANFGCVPPHGLDLPADPVAASPEESAKPGEVAEILLEIRDQVGLGPLVGTVYQPVDAVTEAKANNAFVAGIHASETEETCIKPACEASVSADLAQSWKPQAIAIPDQETDSIDRLVQHLRSVSRQLEASADQLEDLELYVRADQLREVAAALRHEARSAGGDWGLSRDGEALAREISAVEAELSLENEQLALENEGLRAEIELLRHALQARTLDRRASRR